MGCAGSREEAGAGRGTQLAAHRPTPSLTMPTPRTTRARVMAWVLGLSISFWRQSGRSAGEPPSSPLAAERPSVTERPPDALAGRLSPLAGKDLRVVSVFLSDGVRSGPRVITRSRPFAARAASPSLGCRPAPWRFRMEYSANVPVNLGEKEGSGRRWAVGGGRWAVGGRERAGRAFEPTPQPTFPPALTPATPFTRLPGRRRRQRARCTRT